MTLLNVGPGAIPLNTLISPSLVIFDTTEGNTGNERTVEKDVNQPHMGSPPDVLPYEVVRMKEDLQSGLNANARE